MYVKLLSGTFYLICVSCYRFIQYINKGFESAAIIFGKCTIIELYAKVLCFSASYIKGSELNYPAGFADFRLGNLEDYYVAILFSLDYVRV
jgi:hypothetical protein